MDKRLIICGGVRFQDRDLLFRRLDMIIPLYPDCEIISGHARGADSLAEEYARSRGLKLTLFPADWKRYGKGAGPIRNREMLHYAREADPLVVAFWDGKSRGTGNMLAQAEKAGVPCEIIYYPAL